MAFKIEDIPLEVQKVWVVQHYCETMRTGVGSELYNECQGVINKYPEWFPADPKEEISLSEGKLNQINSGK